MNTVDNVNRQSSQPRIALITPLRDEEKFIEALIVSIVNQQVRPEKWLIVDDGSTDQTPAIVQKYCREFKFIEMLQLPPRADRRPGGEGAIGVALRALDLSSFDYLARFDADLLFESDYFARMLREFDLDPRLGIAGGSLYIERDGQLIPECAPEYHVRGALKMYRRECFEELGQLATDIGWDTIDEVYAWSRGWRTRSFSDAKVIHRRPTGGGIAASRIFRERGRAEYLTWSHPGFVVLKTVKLSLASPTNAWSFFSGFVRSYTKRSARLQDPKFRRTRRAQQWDRMRRAVFPKAL